MSKQQLSLVCFYMDIGRPYLPLIKRMTESAKDVMPDCETVLLTPTPSDALYDCFDTCVHMKFAPNFKTLAFDRVNATIAWQHKNQKLTAYIDPDIEFRKPLEFPEDADVGLMWRGKNAHPINEAIVFSRPGCMGYWRKYGAVAHSLPESLRCWWVSQMSHSMIVGTNHEAGEIVQAYGSRVKLIPYQQVCCEPERATDETPALHLKGARKGDGWHQYFAKGMDEAA